MSWTPEHPGGRITCDHDGCTSSRRNYCTPAERDTWVDFMQGDAPGINYPEGEEAYVNLPINVKETP